jgi:hypothetical protein
VTMRVLDVPSLIKRLARPLNTYYTSQTDIVRQVTAVHEIKSVVDDACGLDEAEQLLWQKVERNHAHTMRYPSPKNRAEVRFVDHHAAKVDALLEAIAVLRGGPVYQVAKMTVDREWQARRCGDATHRIHDESELAGLKHGDLPL